MAFTGCNRRVFSSGAASLVALAAAPALRAQPRLEKSRLTLAFTAKSDFRFLPLIVAEQLGYFSARGVELDIGDFPSGSADVVAGSFEQIIRLHDQGQRVQSFVLLNRSPAVSMGISSRALPHYQSLANLKGMRVGVTKLGSLSHITASVVLARGGVKGTELSFIAVGSGNAALAALRSGQIDAICHTEPVMTQLEQKGDIRIIADTRTLKGSRDIFGGTLPSACLYASADFVQKNPRTVQALTDAVVHSLKWLQTAGPSDIIKTVPEAYLLGDRALYLAAFNKLREVISPDGLMPDDGPRTALQVLAAFDTSIKTGSIDLGRTYSNLFASQVSEPFKARRPSV